MMFLHISMATPQPSAFPSTKVIDDSFRLLAFVRHQLRSYVLSGTLD